jgi:hypothetical protein
MDSASNRLAGSGCIGRRRSHLPVFHAQAGAEADREGLSYRLHDSSAEGKEALIKRWMDRKKCNRLEAMRLAVEEWRRENR